VAVSPSHLGGETMVQNALTWIVPKPHQSFVYRRVLGRQLQAAFNTLSGPVLLSPTMGPLELYMAGVLSDVSAQSQGMYY